MAGLRDTAEGRGEHSTLDGDFCEPPLKAVVAWRAGGAG